MLGVEELHQRDGVLAGGPDQALVGGGVEGLVLAQMGDDALPELVHRGPVEPEIAGRPDQRALSLQMGEHAPQRFEIHPDLLGPLARGRGLQTRAGGIGTHLRRDGLLAVAQGGNVIQ